MLTQHFRGFGFWAIQTFGLSLDDIQAVWLQEQKERSAWGIPPNAHIKAFWATAKIDKKVQRVSICRFSLFALCDWFLRSGNPFPERLAVYLRESLRFVVASKMKKAMPYDYRITPERIDDAVSCVLSILFGGCLNDNEYRRYVIPEKIDSKPNENGFDVVLNSEFTIQCGVDNLSELIAAQHASEWVLLYSDNHKTNRVSPRPRLNVIRSACNYVARHFVEMCVGKSQEKNAPEYVIDQARRIFNQSRECFPIDDFLSDETVNSYHQAIAYAEMTGDSVDDKLARFHQWYGSPIEKTTYYDHRQHAFGAMERWLKKIEDSLIDA